VTVTAPGLYRVKRTWGPAANPHATPVRHATVGPTGARAATAGCVARRRL